tara:strand:+ start:179 stop:403 length:225 start_codon:yes stop_codon:yes gene_type:complete
MINLIVMDGYGAYVWSSFLFTLTSFAYLYFVTQLQYVREKNKFITKFDTLDSKKAKFAISQNINKEILSNTSGI